MSFYEHLEACFLQLQQPYFNVLWQLIGINTPADTSDCWKWCFKVIQAFQSLDNDASLERAYSALVTETRGKALEVKEVDKQRILEAMFAILCWTSATLKPIIGVELVPDAHRASTLRAGQNFRLTATNVNRTYTHRDVRRPISKIFYVFSHHSVTLNPPQQDSWAPAFQRDDLAPAQVAAPTDGQGVESTLFESSLNYASLHTIGRLRLKWVDTLTEHLVLHRSTREVGIFRIPSLCVANIIGNSSVQVLEGSVYFMLIFNPTGKHCLTSLLALPRSFYLPLTVPILIWNCNPPLCIGRYF